MALNIHTIKQRKLYGEQLGLILSNVQRLITTAEQVFNNAQADAGVAGYDGTNNDMEEIVNSIDNMYAQIDADLTRIVDGFPLNIPAGVDAFGLPTLEYNPWLDVYAKNIDTSGGIDVDYGTIDDVWKYTITQHATTPTLVIESVGGSNFVFSKFEAGDKALVSGCLIDDTAATFSVLLHETELEVTAATTPDNELSFDLPIADFPFPGPGAGPRIRFGWPKIVRIYDANGTPA